MDQANEIPPYTPQDVFQRLTELDVAHETQTHPPVFTVEDAKRLRGPIVGAHTKNLFLRDKKRKMYLVTCLEDRTIDLKGLAQRLETKNLSFASHQRLTEFLGVIPGAVTPFAAINDRNGAVTVILDAALREASQLNFHPLDNSMTTSLHPDGLLRFLDAIDHPPRWMDFD